MRLKTPNVVKITNLTPQLLIGIIIAESVFKFHAGVTYEVTITSIDDGVHGPTTLHGTGRAGDLRTKDLPATVDKQKLLADVKLAVGKDFDVLLEYVGTDNEHMHIEYDPNKIAG